MSGYRAMPPGMTGVWKMAALGVVLLCAACSGNSGGGPAASTGSGSLAYSVDWEPPPPGGAPASGLGPARPLAPVIDVCTDYGIDTITMKILAGTTTLLSSSFPCEQHTATLNDVPAGDNLVLRLEANVPGAGTSWIGNSLFSLAAGQTKDIGKVSMSYVGTKTTTASVVSKSPDNNAIDVEYLAVVTVNFSERMAINTVIDADSIVLQDNASTRVPATVTYSDNTARIVPDAPLASGVTHLVTLFSAITDMTGKPLLGTPYQWSFKVHERGTWTVPLPLVADPDVSMVSSSLKDDGVSVAGSGNGDAFVLWVQENIFEGTPPVIIARRFSGAEKSWGSSVPLTLNTSSDPQVVMDNNGNAYSVFVQNGASWIRRYIAGNWEKAQVISDGANTSRPQIAVDGGGNAVMAWLVAETLQNRLCSRGYLASSVLTPPRGLADCDEISGGNFAISDPRVVSDAAGNATAVWVELGEEIWAKRKPVGSGFYFADFVFLSGGNKAVNPDLAIGGNGDVFAVWREEVTSTQWQLWARRYPAGATGWEAAILLKTGEEPSSLSLPSPKVSVDGNGNAFVVWHQDDGSGFGKSDIWVRRYAGGWGSAQKIGVQESFYPFRSPQVAVDADGNAFVVWGSETCPSSQVWGNRYQSANGTWAGAVKMKDTVCNAAVNVAATRPGEAVAAFWSFPIGGEGGLSILYQSRNF